MKERPILFSAPMVRAILNGTKSQTRRVFTAKNGCLWPNKNDLPGMRQVIRSCPYGQAGDRLWVREAWGYFGGDEYLYQQDKESVGYRASQLDGLDHVPGGRWRPSIHMPRWASRILLEIVAVGIQRLQDISKADAIAEGVLPLDGSNGPNYWTVDAGDVHLNNPTARGAYSMLWDWINKPGAWDKNPWVWVVEFRRLP